MSTTTAKVMPDHPLEASLYRIDHAVCIEGLKETNHISYQTIEPGPLSRLSDPIEVLPQELWEQIVLESTPDSTLLPIRSHFSQIIMLTAVSNRWHQAILSTPRFWNVIEVADEIEDLEVKVFMSLNLSQDLPLYLECQIPVRRYDVAGLLRAQDRHRIRSINVTPSRYHTTSAEVFNSHVRRFFLALDDLSSLEDLYFHVYEELTHDLDDVLSRAGNLRMLYGASTSKEILQLDSLLNLRRLGCTLRLEEVVEILPRFKRLERLYFLKSYDPYEQIDIPQIPNTSEIDSISVNELGVDLRRPGRIECFLPHVTSNLTTLRTTINWSTLIKLMHVCDSMSHLHTLEFDLLLSTDVKFQPPPQDSVALRLRVLVMELGKAGGVYLEQQDLQDKHENIDLLFSTLVNWAPGIQELTIGSSATNGSPWSYVTQLKDLKVLGLSFAMPLPTYPSPILLPTVKEIWVWNQTNITTALECPASLNCSVYLPSGGSDLYKVATDGWQNLRTLRVPGAGVEWSGISLPNLGYIRLYPAHGEVDETTNYLFYEEMARNPSSFPALQKIEDQGLPELDTLFIMLERRNIASPQGVKAISTLIVPLLPPPFILQPLTNRLRGQMSPRPSNLSLSKNGMASIYFDQDILGCAICHQLFWSCSERWQSIVPFSRKSQGTVGAELFDPKLPPYPDSVEEILKTRKVRIQAWSKAMTEYNETYGTRTYVCARNSFIDTVEITGYTLHDSVYQSVELYHSDELESPSVPRK